jgi:hypothetical protein
LHGVGHGIHNVYGNIPQSLELCGEIATSHTDCYDGVFMDAFDPEGATIDTKYALAEAIQICASTTKIAQPSCYFYVPRAVPQAEVTSIIELCTSAEIGNGWSACAEGSGVYFMKYVSGFNKAVATSYCQAYTDSNMETLCLDGIADYEQYGGLENTKWH